ncbi:hypothetical protein [Olleya sp. ITB9]|uniref:hypothetical protein n=1 Tax=Olleya sp. ITB9 TaxID=1715648 RepID=UPI0006CF9ECF|nr:hypothetical protein [Olleya sp. ITB9]
MNKEILETIVNYTVDDINNSVVVNNVLEDKNLNHKKLKFSINQEDIILETGTKGVGLFYDQDNNFQFKIENYYDNKNLEIKTIEYNLNNEIKRVIKYENYSNGEAKWIRSYDKDENLLSEDFYEEDFWSE